MSTTLADGSVDDSSYYTRTPNKCQQQTIASKSASSPCEKWGEKKDTALFSVQNLPEDLFYNKIVDVIWFIFCKGYGKWRGESMAFAKCFDSDVTSLKRKTTVPVKDARKVRGVLSTVQFHFTLTSKTRGRRVPEGRVGDQL